MKKLIELDAAIDAVHRNYDTILDFRSDGETVANSVEDILSELPAVDAAPVRHGRWKEDPSGYGFWICSACGFVSEASAANMLYKFCPVCGADMRKDDDNGQTD
ncbi:MAG: hypothetical protein II008_15130 [Oscillospiraceae bacterium]|nr:hypothetical protein [Oscillospiraceae bacterium]